MIFHPPPFVPRRGLASGHLQTIFGNFLRRPDLLPPSTSKLIEVAPATSTQISSQVLCHCHWQPSPAPGDRLTVILLHGLEGSSASQYVVGNANKLFRAGFNVVRMNMRNCGGTESLSPTLYHSGLSGDPLAVIAALAHRHALTRFALAGYSMGGNIVLKLAGELGAGTLALPPNVTLAATVAISPAADLAASSDAIHRPRNRIYEHRFLSALRKRFRRKARLFPTLFDPHRLAGIHSVRGFDEQITAFYSGFTGAADYYHRAAAARVVDRIAHPTLVLHAQDDPFILLTPPTRAALRANPHVTLMEPAHGGHCAFLATPHPAQHDDGYWAETTLLGFLQSQP